MKPSKKPGAKKKKGLWATIWESMIKTGGCCGSGGDCCGPASPEQKPEAPPEKPTE